MTLTLSKCDDRYEKKMSDQFQFIWRIESFLKIPLAIKFLPKKTLTFCNFMSIKCNQIKFYNVIFSIFLIF